MRKVNYITARPILPGPTSYFNQLVGHVVSIAGPIFSQSDWLVVEINVTLLFVHHRRSLGFARIFGKESKQYLDNQPTTQAEIWTGNRKNRPNHLVQIWGQAELYWASGDVIYLSHFFLCERLDRFDCNSTTSE